MARSAGTQVRSSNLRHTLAVQVGEGRWLLGCAAGRSSSSSGSHIHIMCIHRMHILTVDFSGSVRLPRYEPNRQVGDAAGDTLYPA
jgi:hypothetical protein